MSTSAGNLEVEQQDSLCLDTDVQVGRLAGDREVAVQHPFGDQPISRPVVDLGCLLVGNDHHSDPGERLLGQIAHRAEHRGEAALHVVGTTSDQAVSVDHRLELLLLARHHVEVPVEDDLRHVVPATAGIGKQDGQACMLKASHLDPP